MAARWSSERIVADYRDLQANTMALDCTGQFVALAGRRCVAIVHLDRPVTPLKKAPRHSKWEVNASEWSPHCPEMFVLACNQRAELLSWGNGDLNQQHILRAHTRAISDVNWSVFDANILATASIDTFINLWDIRDPRKPAICLSAVAGATQVKWNKVTPNLLATSHEGDIRLWDPRKGTSPIQYIAAHLSKIHGLDWSPTHEHHLATSSQDCSVKFWDITSPKRVENMLSLSSGCPVWRARYTPFGDGLVTVVVPQLRRGENSLVLWNISNLSSPVHTFVGHSDVVMEFGWRKQKEDSRDYHLVTWSKDQSLRIWIIDVLLQQLCGHETMAENDMDVTLSPLGGVESHEVTDTTSQASQTSPRETEAGGQSTPPHKAKSKKGEMQEASLPKPPTPTTPISQPQNLQQEFSLVNMNIPNVTVDEMDATKRTCTVTGISGKHVVCLKVTFPSSYPYNASPNFHFVKGTTVDSNVKTKLLKVLQMVSQQQVKRNRSCLEPCLRQLVTTLESCTAEGIGQRDPDSPYHLDPAKQTFIQPPVYGSFQDASVPFPRTSGARFCGAELLVCFMRPPHLQRINAPTEVTPRSLSALTAYLSTHVLPIKGRPSPPAQYPLVYPPVAQSPTGDTTVSISSFYHQERKKKHKSKRDQQERRTSGQQQPSNSGAVLVYSVSGLMPINQMLAENYVFHDTDVASMCTRNANIAMTAGRKDLVQVWSLAALIASPLLQPSLDPDLGTPWAQHPFGRKMIQSLIFHYVKLHDIQTAAMLCCAFGTRSDDHRTKRSLSDLGGCSQLSGKWWLKPGGSPYHTVVPTDTTWEGWSLVGTLKRNRSNSWSDSVEEYRLFETLTDQKDVEREAHEANTRLLDSKLTAQYDEFKKAYGKILYRWNLLEQRTQVLKYVSAVPDKHKGVEFITECQNCHRDVRGAQCTTCKSYSLQCAICHVAVKGCSNFCLSCGHGGHTYHLEAWFQKMNVCPAGCGCKCLEESTIFGS